MQLTALHAAADRQGVRRTTRTDTMLYLRRRWLSIAMPALMASGFARSVHAQSVSMDPRVVQDSTVIRLVVTSVFQTIASDAARAAMDPAQRSAWQVTLPDSLAPAWQRFRSHLFRVVGGRPATSSDERYVSLHFTSLSIRGDTLDSEYSINGHWRCGSRWRGHSSDYEVRSVRYGTSWAPPVTTLVGTGSSAPCPQ